MPDPVFNPNAPADDWSPTPVFNPKGRSKDLDVPPANAMDAVKQVYPTARPTSSYRGPDHPLSKKNPGSWHAQTGGSLDVEPIPGMSFDQYVQGYKDKGYDILEARDEVTNPSSHATGPHWHVVLGEQMKEEKPEAIGLIDPAEGVSEVPLDTAGVRRSEMNERERYGRSGHDRTQFDGLGADLEKQYMAISKTGSVEDIVNWSKANMPEDFWADPLTTAKFVQERDAYYAKAGKDAPLAPVQYNQQAPKELGTPTDGESFARGLGNPIELLDEMGAWPDSLGLTDGRENIFNSDKRFADLLHNNQDLNKEILEKDFEENPISTLSGQMISGLAIPFGAQARSVGQLAKVGAGYGVVTTAAHGEGAERLDPANLAIGAGAGAVFTVALGKAFQALAKKWGGKVVETPEGPVIDVQGQIKQPTADDIASAWEGPMPDFLKQSASRTRRPDAELAPDAPVAPKAAPKANPKVASVQAEVARVQEGWTNKPETVVFDKLDELPPEVREQIEADGVADDVMGIEVGGKVYVNANAIDAPEQVAAVVYHESLGHYGLAQMFGEKLDSELMKLYKGNAKLRNDVEELRGQYPEDYSLVKLVDEALAKQSEDGVIDPKFFEKMAVFVRQLARRMNSKLVLSDNEVRAVLAMAHKKVTMGQKSDGSPGGNKYMVTKGMGPTEPGNDNTIDLSAAREEKALKAFHSTLKGDITEKAKALHEMGVAYHESGKLPFTVGTKFTTNKSKENKQLPWTVRSHYVDPKSPERYGYMVERGKEGSDGYERSLMLVSDPAADARLTKMGAKINRKAEVESWTPLTGPSKYMLRDKRKAEPVGKGKAGNINLDHIKSTKDIEGFIRTAMKDVTPIRESHEDIMDFAKTLKVSTKDMKGFADQMEELPGRMTAMRTVFTTAANNLSTLARKIEVGGENSDITLNRFAEDIIKFNALAESFGRAVGGAGRLLNSLKIDVTGVSGRAADIRYALKHSDAAFLADPANLKAIAKKLSDIDNDTKLTPEARERAKLEFVRKSFEPTWDDGVAFLTQNFLYSGLSTQIANSVGAITMGGVIEIPTKIVSVAIGAVRTVGGLRKSKKRGEVELERVTTREVTSYIAGMTRALLAASTWKSAGRSFMTGTPEHTINRLETGRHTPQDFIDKLPARYHVRKIAAPFVHIISYPQRGLSAADQFFREILHTGHINAYATREAFVLGLKGDEFDAKVAEILSDPFRYSYKKANEIATRENLSEKARAERVKQLVRDPKFNLLLKANHATEVQQLLSEQSFLGKFASQWKAPKDTQMGKVVRVMGIILLPASHTTDRALGAILRNVPILNFLDNETRKMWARGGAERDAVVARMVIGASLIAAFVKMSDAGVLSGDLVGTPDEKAKQRTNKKLENAMQIGGTQVSTQRLDVLSGLAAMTATINEKYKKGDMTKKGYVDAIFNVTGEMLKQMNHNDFTRNISDLFQSMGPMGNPKQYVGRTVARMAVPNVVRQTNKEFVDPIVRNTRADDTADGAIIANVKSAIPGLSDDLPALYDTYGREQDANMTMLGVGKTQAKETDPVVKEVDRLGATPGPVDKGDLNKVYPDAPSDIVMEYQQTSGQYILETIREAMDSGEWDDLTDEEKAKEIKRITKDMRKYTREEMFEPSVEE